MRSILVGLLCVMMTGCATLPGWERPDITLVGLDIEAVEVFETRGTITLRLVNSDRRSMTVDGGAFKLFLNGAEIGQGVSNHHTTLEGLSSATFEVPLFISNLRLASRGYSMLKRDREIDYKIKSKLWLGGPFGSRKVRLTHDGRFDLDRIGDS